MNKKENEFYCLKYALEKCPFLQKYENVSNPNQERPDFILKNKTNDKIIGIEHFYCDILNYKDSNNSLSKTKNNYLEKERKNFCKSIDKEDCLPKARVCIEKETNELIDYSNNFNYSRFVKNFKNIFDNHLEKVNKYKEENCIYKIVFII